MDFVFNRHSGVNVRTQLVTQIEMKILGGAWAPGERLPSVRAMARRLKLHPNTVSAAYRDLQAAGHVELQRGSGVFVRGTRPARVEEAQDLDELVRRALGLAFQRGHATRDIRMAVERWLDGAPADRVVVLDRSRAMAELLAHELHAGLGVCAECLSLEDIAVTPERLRGAVAVTLPYHVQQVRQLAPTTLIEPVTLAMSEDDRRVIETLAAGSCVLVVSHSPTVLPFAANLLSSLRGNELDVHTHLRSAVTAWRRLLPAADLVFADALAVEALRRARPRRLREVRVVRPDALERLRAAMVYVQVGRRGARVTHEAGVSHADAPARAARTSRPVGT